MMGYSMLSWLVAAAAVVAAAAAAGSDQYEQQATRLQHAAGLQVGREPAGPVHQVLTRLRRQAEQRRHRRDYIQWYSASSTAPQQPNFIQTYQIHSTVPYFVPIWGNPRRIPIFFPAKPILFNPGYPSLNPPSSRPTTPEPPVTTGDGDVKVTIERRFPEIEDRPVWGIVEPEAPASPATTPPPASRPARPTRPPSPPLLHRPSLSEDNNQNNRENTQPSGIRDRDIPNFGQPPTVQPFRPPGGQFRPQTTTPPPPPAAAGGAQGREEPNRCVWAIISCCNPTNNQISYNCFERLGCPGAFWDNNPCSRETTAAAFNTAAKFYQQT